MSIEPWLAIIGMGDSAASLSEASRVLIDRAEVVFGGARHLALIDAGERGRAWPLPFSVEPVLAERGRPVVVLASGDPFWFGAGSLLAERLEPGEWLAHPAPSTFSLAAARLGWRMEEVACLGLHAAPFERLVPVLHEGRKAICLLRDAPAVNDLARWLVGHGAGASRLHVLEALGGPRERVRMVTADSFTLADVCAPVAVAIEVGGVAGISRASGLPDDGFAHDGQITKRPIRAMTLSALAPRPGELLWDLGAGSGSISVEWCLAGGRAIAVERHADRLENIRANALRFGVDHRLEAIEAASEAIVPTLPVPDAVFIGGGCSQALLDRLWEVLPPGVQLVVNGVTLETEALLAQWHGRAGGELLRIELATAQPLGTMRGWQPARPLVQWSVTR